MRKANVFFLVMRCILSNAADKLGRRNHVDVFIKLINQCLHGVKRVAVCNHLAVCIKTAPGVNNNK